MNSNIQLVLGTALMAFCGSVIGRKLGYEGMEQAYVAGFAIGVILLAQLSTSRLRKRVADLEAKLASTASEA